MPSMIRFFKPYGPQESASYGQGGREGEREMYGGAPLLIRCSITSNTCLLDAGEAFHGLD